MPSFLKAVLSFVFIFAVACTTTQTREPSNDTNSLTWVSHPCPDKKGVPFRKYRSFALDAQGVIYGRASTTAKAVEIKDRPKTGDKWTSLQQFLDQEQIPAACAGQGETVPPKSSDNSSSKPSKGDYNPGNGSFNPPLQFDVNLYYGPLKSIDGDFRTRLHQLLSMPHWQQIGESDTLTDSCPSQPVNLRDGKLCVQQKVFTYEEARREMFGDIAVGDLAKSDKDEYEVWDYYCQKWRTEDEFKEAGVTGKGLPGPGNIASVKLMNTEHTWPQSKFTDPESTRMGLMEKTDLHHIFPTDTKVNADRGNYDFAEVDHKTARVEPCADGYLGQAIVPDGLVNNQKATKYFEPPTGHKGAVARALMYFSVHYNAGMSPLQEYYLREWNKQNPPDQREIARNEAVYKVNGVRNPFVDHPEWADQIDRFCRAKPAGGAVTANDCP